MSIIDHLTDEQVRLVSGAIGKMEAALNDTDFRATEILTPEEAEAIGTLALAMEGEHAKDCPQEGGH